ncbi:MAG TPA: glutamyl-tRNA reductase [Chloroflexia bacterium]|nr:glutamyl-tRNA reductase [Chloroflexia bacterium]
MSLFVAGVSHDTAPIHVREQLALGGDALIAALRRSRGHFDECVILSTCNRFEVYAFRQQGADDVREPGALLDALFDDLPPSIGPNLYSDRDADAARHLFRVASGIDSLILGEVQILGQAQRAWQVAHQAGVAGPVLSQLFHRAVALGKRVHNETPISRQPASVSYAAVVLARQILGAQLADRRALVIGMGEVGEGVARCLHDYGVRPTLVTHRQLERAETIARQYQADTAAWEDLPSCLARADIVISSTAAPHYIIQRHHIEEAVLRRGERPLYLIDLAVPRDIDPEVAKLPGVHLHNIDDLHSVVRTTLRERESVLPEIEAMVTSEAARFTEWLRARSTAPTIKELQTQADDITQRELARAFARLPDLDERERRVVEVLASRIAGKLLHGPIQWLKAQAESQEAQAEAVIGQSPTEEPDYGMSRLTTSELAELFYRGENSDEGAGDGDN